MSAHLSRPVPGAVPPVDDVSLLRAAAGGPDPLHVLLVGARGAGKTSLARAAHPGLITVSCSADTEVGDLLGAYVPCPGPQRARWVHGPVARAALEGRPVLLDEVHLPDPRQLAVLHPAMDGQGVLRVAANPDLPEIALRPGFTVIGAMTPDDPRSRLSEALRSRFSPVVEVLTDYGPQGAVALGVPEALARACATLDERRREGQLLAAPQMRDLLLAVRVARRFGWALALRSLVDALPPVDAQEAARVLAPALGVRL